MRVISLRNIIPISSSFPHNCSPIYTPTSHFLAKKANPIVPWVLSTIVKTPMETSGTSKRSLIRKSASSFRLRCASLNSLRLRRIFDVFDKNNDGMITVDELSQALNLLGLDADASELDSMMSSYIQPGNAGLTFEDFVGLHQSLNDVFFGLDELQNEINNVGSAQEESDLSEAFKVFDEDGDGYISARELQVVLRKLGFPEGGEFDRVEQMISCVDRDEDGRVDFFEFKDMMRSVVVRT